MRSCSRTIWRKYRSCGIGASVLMGWIVVGATVVAGDGPVSAAQEILRRSDYYHGEVTGRLDEATVVGVRQFQRQNRLTVTGELDPATLTALEATARAESETHPPGGSVRERAARLLESDAEFLARIGQGDSNPDHTGQDVSPPGSGAPAGSLPEPEQSEGPGAAISTAEATRFVENYLGAAEEPTPGHEIAHYADEVEYFDRGRVSQSFVARDQRAYYRRWPVLIACQTLSAPGVLRVRNPGKFLRLPSRPGATAPLPPP